MLFRSWALPIVSIALSLVCILVLVDWEYYYVRGDYNAVFGLHINPWRYLVLTSSIQFLVCTAIVIGHFMAHWRCIYEPEYYDDDTRFNICHDWIPYEIMAIVYGLLLFVYAYKRFDGDPLNSNTLDRRTQYYLWVMAFLLFVVILWMIIEIVDAHLYIYDIIGFLYLWFVAPVFFVLLRSFKRR